MQENFEGLGIRGKDDELCHTTVKRLSCCGDEHQIQGTEKGLNVAHLHWHLFLVVCTDQLVGPSPRSTIPWCQSLVMSS